MKWQPIETAPTDGTAVLGFWLGNPVDAENYAVTMYSEYVGWRSAENDEATFRTPDFWIPLPEPPK